MAWQFWVDRGGTFTDVVALGPEGRPAGAQGAFGSARAAGDPAVRPFGSSWIWRLGPIPEGCIESSPWHHRGHQCLLEQAGDGVLLITNQGLAMCCASAINTGRSCLPPIKRPAGLSVLCSRWLLIGCAGPGNRPLQLDGLREQLEQWRAAGLRSYAIALMHAYRNPDHELALQRFAAELGFERRVCSHQVCPLPRLVPRGQTALVKR